MDRLAIYADLGVPEVWRFDGEHLEFLILGANGAYESSETSRTFPFLRADDVLRFLTQRTEQDALARQQKKGKK